MNDFPHVEELLKSPGETSLSPENQNIVSRLNFLQETVTRAVEGFVGDVPEEVLSKLDTFNLRILAVKNNIENEEEDPMGMETFESLEELANEIILRLPDKNTTKIKKRVN